MSHLLADIAYVHSTLWNPHSVKMLSRLGLNVVIDVARSSGLPFDFKRQPSMVKKQNSTASPNPHSVPNRDIMQRLNFLYQASAYLSSLSATNGRVTPTTRPEAQSDTSPNLEGKEKQTDEVPLATPAYLSRAYVSSMKAIGQKTVVKL